MAQDKFIKEFKGNLSREQKKNYKSHMKHKNGYGFDMSFHKYWYIKRNEIY